jgi:hypothetical protein
MLQGDVQRLNKTLKRMLDMPPDPQKESKSKQVKENKSPQEEQKGDE